MATFTVTEALVKLKLAQKKIDDATVYTLTGAVGTKATDKLAPAGFKSVEDYKKEIRKRLDSVTGLISFRDRLKKAIVESNAKTSVSVGSKTMTVAEAIETKNSILSRKVLLEKLVRDWTSLESQVNAKNANLEQRADAFVTQLYGQSAGANESDKLQARQNYIANNSTVIVTDDSFKSRIETLKNEIDEFETNVDVALSIVNATTKVSVDD